MENCRKGEHLQSEQDNSNGFMCMLLFFLFTGIYCSVRLNSYWEREGSPNILSPNIELILFTCRFVHVTHFIVDWKISVVDVCVYKIYQKVKSNPSAEWIVVGKALRKPTTHPISIRSKPQNLLLYISYFFVRSLMIRIHMFTGNLRWYEGKMERKLTLDYHHDDVHSM